MGSALTQQDKQPTDKIYHVNLPDGYPGCTRLVNVQELAPSGTAIGNIPKAAVCEVSLE